MSNNNGAMQTPPTLKFNPEYYTKILCGDKTQTTRLHLKEGIEVGKIVEAKFNGLEDVILPLIVKKITIKKFFDLNKKDAKREGYLSKANLELDLMRIYPNLERDSTIYCIEFYLQEGWITHEFDIKQNQVHFGGIKKVKL